MRRLLATIVFFAAASAAAQVRLSAEMPLSPALSSSAAPHEQVVQSIATNGRGSLLLWTDARSSGTGFVASTLYAMRIEENGQIVDPIGHPVTRFAASAALSSDGTGYIVAYVNDQGLFTMRLDDYGWPIDAPRQIAPFENITLETDVALAWNGANHLLIRWTPNTYTNNAVATVLDTLGAPLNSYSLPFAELSALWVSGADFNVVANSWPCGHGCVMDVRLLTLSTAGITTDRLLMNRPETTNVAAAVADDRILVATAAMTPAGTLDAELTITASQFTLTGTPINEQTVHREIFPAPAHRGFSIWAGWDGNNFLVAWERVGPTGSSYLAGVRYSRDGVRLDINPFVIDPKESSGVTFFRQGTITTMLWSNGDITHRRLNSFNELGEGQALPVVIVQTPRAQVNLRLTATASGPFAIWRELSTSARVNAKPWTGSAMTVADQPLGEPPAAHAASDAMVLLVWTDRATNRVLARRVTLGGQFLDPEPLAISAAAIGEIAVASDGTDFLVVWSGSSRLRGAVITSRGEVLPARDLSSTDFLVQHPNVVWAGDRYVVTWRRVMPNHPSLVFASRADTSGHLLDSTDTLLTPAETSTEAADDTLVNGPGFLLQTWVAQTIVGRCILALPFGEDLQPIGTVRPIRCSASDRLVIEPSVVWNGTEFVMAWTEGNHIIYSIDPIRAVKAMRLRNNLTPIDSEPFYVSPAAELAFGPSVAVESRGSVAIGYSRITGGDYANVARAYVRVLERLGGRMRTVR